MNSSSQLTKILSNQNLIAFVAALGVGVYAVYNVGDLQTVIYAVCGAYVLRLLVQNPEVLARVQHQLYALQGHTQPVAALTSQSPTVAHPGHPELVPAMSREPTVAVPPQPRLDMNILNQTGYQPLQVHQQQRIPQIAFDPNTPTTPVPTYPQFSATSMNRAPHAGTGYHDNFPGPTRNPFSQYIQLNGSAERLSVHSDERNTTPRASLCIPRGSISIDPRMSIVSTFSAFPEPTRNPYTSYAHYDAGTIGGERLVQRLEVPIEYTTPNFNLDERIAAPPRRPDSSMRSATIPVTGNYSSVQLPSRSSSASPESVVRISEYVPKRQHRKPTVAARVGVVAPPGGGIAPPPSASPAPAPLLSKSPEAPKFFGSPVVESPVVSSHDGYDSDSSHAASSTGSNDRASPVSSNGHARSESSASSLGLPTYEKHATTIFTLVPKRPGYVPQIQAILKASRQTWLALPGTVTHEVGQDNTTGSVVVVETYESQESMEDFEKSKERGSILERLNTFIDESKTSIVRLPGSSAATRIVR